MPSDQNLTIFGFPVKFVQEMTPTQKLFHDWYHPPSEIIDYQQETSSRACPRCGKRMRRYRTLLSAVWRDVCKNCGWRN